MKTFRVGMVSIIALAFLASSLPAQEHPEHPTKSGKSEATDVIEATVEGENVCLGCSLKKKKGASAQCSKYGHRHVLKVTSATVDGKERPEMKGWVLHYLETDKAEPVIKDHHEETLTITGKVYAEERTLEVNKLAESKETKKPEHPEHPEK